MQIIKNCIYVCKYAQILSTVGCIAARTYDYDWRRQLQNLSQIEFIHQLVIVVWDATTCDKNARQGQAAGIIFAV